MEIIITAPTGIRMRASEEAPTTGDALAFAGHATTLLRLDGACVLTDPVAGRWVGPLRRHGPIPDASLLEAADVVLLSHLHRDHFDLRTLRRLPASTPLVVPRGAAALAARAGAREVLELSVGEEIRLRGIGIEAVPADHDPRRGRGPWGPRADPLGYLISTPRRRIYFAGDTELFGEMSALGPLDLALLPVWGWGPSVGEGHLDPLGAARALTLLRPRLAVPIHWGTFYPLGLAALHRDRLRRPPLELERLAAELAPEVRVRVLAAGSGLDLDVELDR